MLGPSVRREGGSGRVGAPGSAASGASEQPGTRAERQSARAPTRPAGSGGLSPDPEGRPPGPTGGRSRRDAVAEAVAVTNGTALIGPHAPNWEERANSRLSKTNPADSTTGDERDATPRSRFTPLTESNGVTLREEVRDFGAIDGDRPLTWNRAITQYRAYIEDQRDVQTVFEDSQGNTARGSTPHRFSPEYSDKQYAKLKDLERGLVDDYGSRLHTAMLTFTASGAPDGEPLPPVDHLNELDSSWDSITRELRRALDDRRYERLAILEPHPGDGANNGYLHIHLAVFVDGPIARSTLAPVIEAHLRNCDLAQPDAHDVRDDSTISIRHAGRDRDDGDDGLDELAIYLAEYLGTYGDDPLDQPEFQQAANTLLWATGKQRWRPSNGAQQYMRTEAREPDSEWEVIGIETDDEFTRRTDSAAASTRSPP